MKTIPFNLNDHIKAKLNEHGIKILRDAHDELKQYVPSLGEFKAPPVDADGYSTFQMWNFMETFGPSMYMSNTKMPFELNVFIETED